MSKYWTTASAMLPRSAVQDHTLVLTRLKRSMEAGVGRRTVRRRTGGWLAFWLLLRWCWACSTFSSGLFGLLLDHWQRSKDQDESDKDQAESDRVGRRPERSSWR